MIDIMWAIAFLLLFGTVAVCIFSALFPTTFRAIDEKIAKLMRGKS